MTKIDSHTHVWPPSIARKAMDGARVQLEQHGDGTVDGLSEALDTAGIDRAICLGVATVPEHVGSTNRFIGELPDRFIGFGSVHPGLDIDANIESLRENGLAGAKFHPIFQGVSVLDPATISLMRAMSPEFVVIVHCGRAPGRGEEELCTPAMVRELSEAAADLEIIACHFGGLEMLEEASRELVGSRVYLDTSYPPSLAAEQPETVRDLIRRHGPERVVFGSDWPFADPLTELEAVNRLGLTDVERDGILGENLERLLEGRA